MKDRDSVMVSCKEILEQTMESQRSALLSLPVDILLLIAQNLIRSPIQQDSLTRKGYYAIQDYLTWRQLCQYTLILPVPHLLVKSLFLHGIRSGNPRLVQSLLHCHCLLESHWTGEYIQEDMEMYEDTSRFKLILPILLSHPSFLSKDLGKGQGLLTWCWYANDTTSLQLLLSSPSIHPSHQNNLVLRQAYHSASWDIAYILLQNPRTEPEDFSGQCLVRCASLKDWTWVLAFLNLPSLFPGTFDYHKEETLVLACQDGQMGVVRRLLDDSHVSVSVNEYKALIAAREHGHRAILDLLLSRVSMDTFETPQHSKIVESLTAPDLLGSNTSHSSDSIDESLDDEDSACFMMCIDNIKE